MFGYGENHQSSQSNEQGTSSSLGTSSSASASDASSLSSSFGLGSSYGENRSSSSVFGADVFSSLFGDASSAAAKIAAGAGGMTGAANGLFDSGLSFLSELQGLSGAGPAGAGESYLEGRLNGSGDSLLNDQIAGVQSDLQKFFGESVLPGIRRDAIGAGGLGGDRQGVAEGIAGGELTRQFAQAVTALRSNDQAARDSAASTLAGVQASRRLQAAGTGASSLAGQLGLLEGGSMLALSPYLTLSQILGDPTVLSESAGFDTSSQESGSAASSISRSTSSSESRDESSSQYSGSSSSKGKGWNIGFGS